MPGEGDGALYAVTAISRDDAWAVGTAGNIQPLILHWDGAAWRAVPGPTPDRGTGALRAVAGTSRSDVWAVGYSIASQQDRAISEAHPLILHWDGAAWRAVPAPDVGTSAGVLTATLWGVAALSGDDAWAVGTIDNGEHGDPLALHWDGRRWQLMSPRNQTLTTAGVVGCDCRRTQRRMGRGQR